MANIDEEVLAKLSELARIEIPTEKRASLLDGLKKILHYVDKLQEVDTEGLNPCDHVLQMTNVERDDVVGPVLDRKTFLDNAPEHTGGMVRVPPVIKES